MATIDRSSPVPLYYQLKQILLDKINQKDWQPGDLIPSELELQEAYGLSRTTVRQTLAELTTEGHLVRHRGRGTFVQQPKITHDPGTGMALSEYILQQGLEPRWQMINKDWGFPSEAVWAELGLEEGTRVFQFQLQLSANQEPVGIHNIFLPISVAEQTTAQTDEEWLNYLRHMPSQSGHTVVRTLEAGVATAKQAEWLNIEPGSPILLINVKVIDARKEPVQLIQACFRGDRFKYQITLTN